MEHLMPSVTTTNKERFTSEESVQLFLLIYKRFGRDIEATAAAWRRLLQNNTPVYLLKQVIDENC